jgi:rare lipoprotein A
MAAKAMIRTAVTALLLAALVGCASEPDDSLDLSAGNYKVGKPYQIAGVWYYPEVDYDYDETGIASWYGNEFDGRPTANGETFDEDRISAAHKTLPLPSIVRVTNLENDRSLVLRVNDRGPFVAGRIIDLSRRAAEKLGMLKNGTARVRVEIMPDESRMIAAAGGTASMTANERAKAAPVTSVSSATLLPPPGVGSAPAPSVAAAGTASSGAGPAIAIPSQSKPAKKQRMFVQAGSFLHYENARGLAGRLGTLGPTLISRAQLDGQSYFRVLLGPLDDVGSADILLARVIERGQRGARIIVD